MNSRYDRRSGKSHGSKRIGERSRQDKRPVPRKSSADQSFSDEGSPYFSKNKRTGERQSQRGIARNRPYRQIRQGKERGGLLENENERSQSRSSSSRRITNRRAVGRAIDRKVRNRLQINRTSLASQTDGNSYPEGEVITSNNGPGYGQSPSDDMLWGRHATQSALEAGRPLHRIWCTPELRNSQRFLQLLRDAKSSGVLVEEVTWARLGQLTNGAVHQGIAIQTASAETLDLSTLIEGCNELGEPPLLLALDGLTDPQNLGAIVRSAEAFGAHGLVLPQRRSAGLTGSVAKVAAGALEHLPVARVVNLNRSLEELKKSGYLVIGLAEEGSETLPEVDLEGPLVLVTGSEGKGISLVTRRHCDHLVRIPLRGVTPSLNASVATAVFLYEVARNGWMKGLSGQAPSPRMVRPKYASLSQQGSESSHLMNEQVKEKSKDKNISTGSEFDSVSDIYVNEITGKPCTTSDSGLFDENIQL